MAFPSTYSDGSFVLVDFLYPYKSLWLNAGSNLRSDTQFNYQEYDIYRQLAGHVLKRNGFTSATSGLRFSYIPAIAKGTTFSIKIVSKENGSQVTRDRVGLRIQYYDTRTQAGRGPTFVFASVSAELMGSFIKKVDKVALSKITSLYGVFTRIYNDNGTTLLSGTAIRFNGVANDGILEVERTDGNSSDNNFGGIVQEDIPQGETGSCASITGPGAWVPNNVISTPTNGGLLYLSGDTGGISHTPGGGGQAIGRLLHVGTDGGAHYISFSGI